MRIASVLAGSVVLLVWRAGRATPHAFEPSALSWVREQGAEACPGGAEMARRVEERLGKGALVSTAQAAIVVEASVRARPNGGFHVEMALVRGETTVGRRELDSAEADCAAIAAEAALVIALTIDPEAASPMDSSAPPPAASPTAPARVQAPPPATTAVSRPAEPIVITGSPEPAWTGELELATGVATGMVPGVSGGLFVRGRARGPSWPIMAEVEGAYFPAKSVDAMPGRGATFQLLYTGVGLCNKPAASGRLRAWLCIGPDFAALSGRGYGFDVTPHFWNWTLALTARGRVALAAGHGFAALLGPDLFLPLGRDRFETTSAAGTDQLFRMKPVGFGFELGLMWGP